MKKIGIAKLSWISTLATVMIAVALGGLVAQEKGKENPPVAKKKAEPKGRLPAYYSDVVSGDQREKIYAIQKSFSEKIDKLQQELDALTSERDKAVEAVLTAEQKDKVAKAKSESAAKTKAKKDDNKKKAAETAAKPAGDSAK